MAFNVLYEVQCKANEIVFSGNYTSSLLASAMHIDTSFYYKFGETDIGLKYLERNYENWFNKAFIIARDMPKRGDLILPFLSYAVNNNKIKDAEKICKTPVKRIEAFCDLITANKLLTSTNINKSVIKNSIELINKAVDKGIFNELAFGKGFSLMERQKDRTFHGWGLEGIPLSSNILFLITDEEKIKLEEIIQEIE